MDQDALDASPVFQKASESQPSWLDGETFDQDDLLEGGDAVDFADADALLAEVEGDADPRAQRLAPVAVLPATPEGNARSLATWGWTGLGAVATTAGGIGIWLTLSNSTALEAAMALMERVGLAPIHLLALGLLFLGLGSAARRQGRMHRYIAQLNQGQDLIGAIMSNVESVTRTLQEAETRRSEQPASSDDMEYVRFELKRADEKIVNLTKATRSFGTPIVEMTRQLTDAAHMLAEQKRGLEAIQAASSAGVERLEGFLRTEVARLEEQARVGSDRLASELKGLRGSMDAKLGKLKDGVPEAVDARLHAATTAFEAQIATHGRHVRESLEAMSTRTEQLLAQMQKAAPAATPKVDLTAIEHAIAAVQRELASLVSSPGRAPAAAPERATSPATPAPTAERAAPAAQEAMPASGVAQAIAGTRAAPAGNVLGAIARLKKMRG